MEARQTARALLADVPECEQGRQEDSGEDVMAEDVTAHVLAMAASARHSADKPQVPAPAIAPAHSRMVVYYS
jgi:hypothetical protein